MKLALREDMTPGESLRDKLAWLEQAGFDGVELCAGSMTMAPDELAEAFANSAVRPANVDGVRTLLSADPAQREEATALLRERIALAGRLGAAGVLLVAQFGALEQPAGEARALLDASLRDLLPDLRGAGTTLYLEPLNRYEAKLVNRVGQGAEIARAVGPEIGTMADFFHMNIEEADIAASIHEAGDRIFHVHVADSNRLQPGRGHLDFIPGFAALKASGYDGYLGLECRIDGPFDAAIAETIDHLRRLWDAA